MNYEQERPPQFDAVIFDLDSTLVTIEGIDELARCKGVEHTIIPLTQQAMNGQISLDEVFVTRLNIIQPTYTDLVWLGEMYLEHITPGAPELIYQLKQRGMKQYIVSGGYNPAVGMVAEALGIPLNHVFANDLVFDRNGLYRGIKRTIPLWQQHGKSKVITSLRHKHPGRYLLVGDGTSDMEAGIHVEQFIGFAGVQQRPRVIHQAETVIYNPDLRSLLAYL